MPCCSMLHCLLRLWCGQITHVINTQLPPHPAKAEAVSGALLWQERGCGLPRYYFDFPFSHFPFPRFLYLSLRVLSVVTPVCVSEPSSRSPVIISSPALVAVMEREHLVGLSVLDPAINKHSLQPAEQRCNMDLLALGLTDWAVC